MCFILNVSLRTKHPSSTSTRFYILILAHTAVAYKGHTLMPFSLKNNNLVNTVTFSDFLFPVMFILLKKNFLKFLINYFKTFHIRVLYFFLEREINRKGNLAKRKDMIIGFSFIKLTLKTFYNTVKIKVVELDLLCGPLQSEKLSFMLCERLSHIVTCHIYQTK